MQRVEAFLVQENPRPLSSGDTANDAEGHRLDGLHLEDLADAQERDAALLRIIAQYDRSGAACCVDLQADYRVVCLQDVAEFLPELQELRLSHGVLGSIRDLGSCWQKLRVLWLTRCSVGCLDGIGSLPALQELYAAYNEISDLEPLQELHGLKVLDLEGNTVDSYATVEWLSLNQKLQRLTLLGNPVAALPEYRQQVLQMVPWLDALDDGPTGPSACHVATTEPALLAALELQQDVNQEVALVQKGIKEARAGLDAVEFDEGRTLSTCTLCNTQCQLSRLPALGLRPGTVASWMRFLQSSSTSSCGSTETPEFAGSSTSAHSSRPPSGEAGLRHTHTATTSSTRPSSMGARRSTTMLAPGTATTWSSTAATMGLYWKKNRLEDPSILKQADDDHLGNQGGGDDGSSLTYGLQGTLSGNFAKELRRWKSSLQEDSGGHDAGMEIASGGDRLQRIGGAASNVLASFDGNALLTQLRGWKEEAAERVLQDVDTASALLCTSSSACCSGGFLSSLSSFGANFANVLLLDSDGTASEVNQQPATRSAPELTTARAVSSRHLLCKILNDAQTNVTAQAAKSLVVCQSPVSRGCPGLTSGDMQLGQDASGRPACQVGLGNDRLLGAHEVSRRSSSSSRSQSPSGSGTEKGRSRPASTSYNMSGRVVITSVAGEMELARVNPRPIQYTCSDEED